MKSKWYALCILSRGPAGLKDGHVGIIDYVEGSTMCWNVNGVNEKKTLHVCYEDCTIRHSYRGRVQVCTASRFRAFLRYTDLQSGRWSNAFLSPLHTSQNTEQEFEKKKSELKICFRFNVQKETTLLTFLRVLYVRKLSWEYITQLKYLVSVSLCPLLQWHLYFVPRDSGELTNLKPSNEAKQHLKSQQAQVERSSFFCYNILNNLLINLQDCNTEAINRITCGPVCDTWLFTQPLTLATDTRNKRFPSVVIG